MDIGKILGASRNPAVFLVGLAVVVLVAAELARFPYTSGLLVPSVSALAALGAHAGEGVALKQALAVFFPLATMSAVFYAGYGAGKKMGLGWLSAGLTGGVSIIPAAVVQFAAGLAIMAANPAAFGSLGVPEGFMYAAMLFGFLVFLAVDAALAFIIAAIGWKMAQG